jgi:hypothetical protein
LIRFIKDKHLKRLKINGVASHVVKKSARARNDNINTPLEAFDLTLHIDAAVNGAAAKASLRAVFLDALINLLYELTSGSDDKRADHSARSVHNSMENGKYKRGCFSGSRLSKAKNVFALNYRGNCIALNGRRLSILFRDTSIHAGIKPEVLK